MRPTRNTFILLFGTGALGLLFRWLLKEVASELSFDWVFKSTASAISTHTGWPEATILDAIEGVAVPLILAVIVVGVIYRLLRWNPDRSERPSASPPIHIGPGGGLGVSSDARSDGPAIAGRGGDAGGFGPGGAGRAGGIGGGLQGMSVESRDAQLASGGVGGKANQPEGRVGRDGGPPGETLAASGRGGSGPNTPGYDRRLLVVVQLRKLYAITHPELPSSVLADKGSVPLDWVNQQLSALGAQWRVRITRDKYEFFPHQ